MNNPDGFIMLIQAQVFSLFYFTIVWRVFDGEAKHFLTYVAYSLTIGFFLFGIFIVVSSRYELGNLARIGIAISYCLLMTRTKILNSMLKKIDANL